MNSQKRDIALLRAARSPLRGTWAPMRLALTRPASASRLAEHAVGPSGAALPARCAAQSCEKQGALLSWSIVQRGCESSTAPVLWCESLMGGNLLLHRHAQSALRPGAEACGLANGASFSTLSSASCNMSQYFCGDEWRAGCVVPRVEWEILATG